MDVLRRDSDGVILQRGSGLGAMDGTTVLTLSDEEVLAYQEARSQPNGGVVMAVPERTFSALPDTVGPAAAVAAVGATQETAIRGLGRRELLAQIENASTHDALQAALLALAKRTVH